MKNELYYGDNLDVLRRKIPSESVDLCYIDPPFNSKRNYFQIYNNQGSEDRAQAQAFVDTWEWATKPSRVWRGSPTLRSCRMASCDSGAGNWTEYCQKD
jgi:DNA modification methylase